jgi:uncharacterized protein
METNTTNDVKPDNTLVENLIEIPYTRLIDEQNETNDDYVRKHESKKRYFKCITITSDNEVVATGRYTGNKPKQAASKAFTKLFEDISETGQNPPEHIIFGIRECTRLCRGNKNYVYIGRKYKLSEPENVFIHLRDPITKRYLLDEKGNKIPEMDPNTNEPKVISYYQSNIINELTNGQIYPEYDRLVSYGEDKSLKDLTGDNGVVATNKAFNKIVADISTISKFHHIDSRKCQIMSLQLAKKIYDSGFRPTKLIALWRGGTPFALYFHEYFKHKGCNIDHIAIRTSSYEGMEQQKEIRVHGLGYIVETANADDEVLIIDDIFDSGKTAKKVIDDMNTRMRLNTPRVIKIATLFYKPTKNQVDFEPEYFHSVTTKWIVFSHEIEDLTDEEILELKGQEIYDLIKA